MQYSKDSPNPSSKAKLTTGHGAFRRLRRREASREILKMRRSRTADNFKFFFGGNSIMNLIHQKIKQKERATSAFASVALG
ncbi:MAG: hypothetical protein AAB645_00405, partial [Patescibacteria group bacterium]